MSLPLLFTCSQCGAKNTWPDYCAGRTLICPACKNQFVDENPAVPSDEEPLQVVLVPPPASQDYDDIPEVIPVVRKTVQPGETPAPPTGTTHAGQADGRTRPASQELTLVPELRDLAEDEQLAEFTPHQRALYALLVATFDKYYSRLAEWLIAIMLLPILIVVGGVFAWGMVWASHALSLLLFGILGPFSELLVYVVPFVTVLFFRGLGKFFENEPVQLPYDKLNQAAFIKIGRLHRILEYAQPVSIGFYFGWLFGTQMGLLNLTTNAAGLHREVTLWQSFLFTFDNLCHGIFLDTFELYDLGVAGEVTHSWVSASWFYAFRLAFDALFVLFLWMIFQRFALRKIIATYPHHLILDYRPTAPSSVDALCDWLDRVCQDKSAWLRRFPNEVLFLSLASRYLQGNYDYVAEVTEAFPWLRIKKDVRLLFVNDKGEELMASTFTQE